MRVLVVDDEFDVADILRIVFEERGDAVWVAHDGAEAQELLQSETPDFVITDVMMPTMSGPELIAWMRSQPRLAHVPVLLMSAIRPPAEDEPMWQGFIQKPFTLTRLLRSLAEVTAA